MTHRPRRSALYMPASNARAIDKARELPCDVVILDLEDAVAPEAKTLARKQAVEAVKAGGFGRREVVIRINDILTPWHFEDMDAVKEARPDAVLVPKVSQPSAVERLRDRSGGITPWIMVETCDAIMHVAGLGEACRRADVACWVMGTNDLAKEMRCRLDVERAPLAPALSMSVIAARANGISILDGVFNDIDDEAGFLRQCGQAADFGFDGKTLIHPKQVAGANAAFTPAEDEVAWARTVAGAFDSPENADKGVLRVEGRMVERLHLEEARRVIAVADAIAEQG